MRLETPICDFDTPAVDFKLKGTDERYHTLDESKGENGLLVMFICNHCPYVQAIRHNLINDVLSLQKIGINSVAIMSNDIIEYKEDNFENMQKIATKYQYPFPYLLDETQEVAKQYGAVCTPDFFGYNKDLKLQYRGRLDNSRTKENQNNKRELLQAMTQIAKTNQGPKEQIPSMGCSIKWRKS